MVDKKEELKKLYEDAALFHQFHSGKKVRRDFNALN